MKAKQTAGDLYSERREEIARLIDWLDLELDKHKTNAKANPNDWGYAGDLGNIRAKLVRAVAFLSNQEPENIEKLLCEEAGL